MSAPAAFAIVAAFNLVCSGDQSTFTTGEKGSLQTTPFAITYRVDLESRRWCLDPCSQTSALVTVSETKLVFSRLDDPPNTYIEVSVNRESGSYSSTIQFGSRNSMRGGTCTPAPFTGFPRRKF